MTDLHIQDLRLFLTNPNLKDTTQKKGHFDGYEF